MKEISTDDLIEDYNCMCVSLFRIYHQVNNHCYIHGEKQVKNRKGKYINKKQNIYKSKMYK